MKTLLLILFPLFSFAQVPPVIMNQIDSTYDVDLVIKENGDSIYIADKQIRHNRMRTIEFTSDGSIISDNSYNIGIQYLPSIILCSMVILFTLMLSNKINL